MVSKRSGQAGDDAPPHDFATVAPQTSPMADYSFTLQAVMELKGRFGGVEAKLDRLIADVSKQSEKLDEVRHQVSFVKGAIWVGGVLIVLCSTVLSLWLSGKLKIGFGP